MKLNRAVLLTLSIALAPVPAFAQGQRIAAKDGDVVVVDNASRVRIIKRGAATVRAIFSPSQHWLVILADIAAPNGASDGGVDASYTFHDVAEWPAGERWEGKASLEEYFVAGEIGNFGLGLGLPSGFVQVLDSRSEPLFRDAAAVSLVGFQGSSRGGGGRQSFDAVERAQVASAMRNAELRANVPAAMRNTSSGIGMTIGGTTTGGVTQTTRAIPPPPDGPVRVGGNVRTPRKVVDAEPVLPAIARQAGIRGIVIMEITIGTDGSVTDAKVLRSIPLLDQAALDAVRQWRYEPTLLNGVPVPVITTVTVSFQ